MRSKYILFIFSIFISNILFAQSIKMKVMWYDDSEPDSTKIESANQILSNKIEPNFLNFLKEKDNDFLNCLNDDSITIYYLVSELRFEGILITVTTDSLLFRKVSFYEPSYQDAKGIFLCETVKLHLATYVWSYPMLITAKDTRDRFYLKYFLPNDKEIIFSYYDYNSGDYMPRLSLSSVEYSKIIESTKKIKKENLKTKEKKFLTADFVEGAQDFYKFDSDFTKYFLPNTHIINFGPK